MKSTIQLDNVTYELNDHDAFERDGNIYRYVSLKKIKAFKKGRSKYQIITVSPDHWERFKEWLSSILLPESGFDEPAVDENVDEEEPF